MTPPSDTGLEVRALRVAFGGNVAVADVTLSAPLGRITGLVGPNGAGKTTTFNACSGLLRPSAGTISILGQDVTKASPARRAQMGLGRTFQRVEICAAMTVAENVEVGVEARMIGRNALRHFRLPTDARRQVRELTASALATCGIAALAARPVGSLSTGQRRLVELARVLAGQFRILLLDEPSSGLDEQETAAFASVLSDIVADGPGILLVEHDMGLVMGVCDRINVLDFGKLIFEGSSKETQTSPIVRAAYLGSEEVAAATT